MRQLTSLDAQFLALETNRQAGHVGGLAILGMLRGAGDADGATADGLLVRLVK